jgi:inositol polyphosphate-4-phosphatase
MLFGCRSVWIAEEKELLQEMIGLGELREPWHSKQVQLLEKHLWLINHYTQARAALMAHKGNDPRQCEKFEPIYM